MEILTDVTLSKLLANCEKYENYVAAILFSSKARERQSSLMKSKLSEMIGM